MTTNQHILWNYSEIQQVPFPGDRKPERKASQWLELNTGELASF
jgi:hypothetical protein